jgi:hypothetical protein
VGAVFFLTKAPWPYDIHSPELPIRIHFIGLLHDKDYVVTAALGHGYLIELHVRAHTAVPFDSDGIAQGHVQFHKIMARRE